MKKTLLVLASALFGMSVGLSVYAADQAPAAAAPAAADGTGSAVYFPLFGDRPVPVRLYTGLVLRL